MACLGSAGGAGPGVAEQEAGVAAGRVVQGPPANGAAGVGQQPGVEDRVQLRAAHAAVLAGRLRCGVLLTALRASPHVLRRLGLQGHRTK